MKIGLVGEAPNDTLSIQNILIKKFSDFDYVFMLDRINGSNLDSQKTKRFLRIEYEYKSPDIIIFIRDLDSLIDDRTQILKRKTYFSDFNSVVDKKGIFLLHIYEIEALILADKEAFNEIYNTKLPDIDNPMTITEPKEFLKKYSSEYNESHNAELFSKLSFDKLIEVKYFGEFIKKFSKLVN